MNNPCADHTSTAEELEGTLAVLEANLLGLSESLRERDAVAMERQAEQLHQAQNHCLSALRAPYPD